MNHSQSKASPKFYAPQTKILEGGTKDEIRGFEALFHGSWRKLSTHTLRKYSKILISSFVPPFQNLRLGGVNFPKGMRNLLLSTRTSVHFLKAWYWPWCHFLDVPAERSMVHTATATHPGDILDTTRSMGVFIKFMLPKRRFWRDWQKMKCDFSKYFSRAWVLDLG